ncbi:MAG TPA: hypothetical protein EYQ43_09955 [Methyloprofundus sp.]|nr:hypothetical protein [Methyloprofundus sp.]
MKNIRIVCLLALSAFMGGSGVVFAQDSACGTLDDAMVLKLPCVVSGNKTYSATLIQQAQPDMWSVDTKSITPATFDLGNKDCALYTPEVALAVTCVSFNNKLWQAQLGVDFPTFNLVSNAPYTSGVGFGGEKNLIIPNTKNGRTLTVKEIIVDPTINIKSPPPACNDYAADGKYGYTYATTKGTLVGALDIARAWVDAGNTPDTAYYGTMLAGGEASQINGGNPGDFVNQITGSVNSGVLQCDTCRDPFGYNNNNICENIWAATRVVLIPQLNVKAKNTTPGETEIGCIIMNEVATDGPQEKVCVTYSNNTKKCYDTNSNYCIDNTCNSQTDENYIGPFCHNTPSPVAPTGHPWSSQDNFPNNYFKGFLKSIVKGNVFSIANGNCTDTSVTVPASTSTECTSELTEPVIKDIANKLASCAINNRAIRNVLDCPYSLDVNFQTNECGPGASCYTTQENCCRMAGATSDINSLNFTNQSKLFSYVATQGLCYNISVGGATSCDNF